MRLMETVPTNQPQTVTQSQKNAPIPSPSKTRIALVLTGIIAVGGVMVAGFLFMKNQSLSSDLTTTINNLAQSKEKSVQLEKDLIFYKSTDLAKEVEILNLKLKTGEEELVTTQANLTKLQADVSSSPKIANIASMMMATFGQQPPNCFSATDKANINQELAAFGDREWISKWEDFINDTDSKSCSMSPDKLEQAVNYGLNKISQISPK